MVTYTALDPFDSFTPTGTGWQDYDIFTNKSIPKGAVVEIFMTNSTVDAARVVGVRTDGSALARFVSIHESEGGGANGYVAHVTVDASTGLIEIYCDATSGVTFYIVGYFEGVTYTERFDALTSVPQNTWNNVDLSGYGVGANEVCQFVHPQLESNWYADMGVRANGSALSRLVRLHECEPSDLDMCSYTNYAKADASSIVELFHQYSSSGANPYYSYLLGYFATDLDYQELWTAKAVGSNSTWTDADLTADLDQDGRVVTMLLLNVATGGTNTMGARENGSSGARYYTEHEAESYGKTGDTFTVQSDEDGIIELYASDAGNEEFILTGYFIFADVCSDVSEVVVDLDASNGEAVELPCVDQYVYVTKTGVTHLPVGRYEMAVRVKDSDQVADDLGLKAVNNDDSTVLNQANDWETKTCAAAYSFRSIIFDVTLSDSGDELRLFAQKMTETSNTITVDYFLIVPVSNGENFPQDVAHQALRKFEQKHKLARRT